MNTSDLSQATLPCIIRNKACVFEGNLNHYFRTVFLKATNLENGYHNFRHIFHVFWLCYQACLYYGDTLTKREKRNLLIAAMFHDYNHSGCLGYDDQEIERAVKGFLNFIAPEDQNEVENIVRLIRVTRFPHEPLEHPSLSELIIRDADLSQAISLAWIQQIIFGLAREMRKSPLEMLRMQEGFLKSLTFITDWAKHMFPQASINAKVDEASDLLSILEEDKIAA